MIRFVKTLVFVTMTCALLTSCDQKMRELNEQVNKFNNECPISYGDMMTLNSTTLEGNTVEMKITANEAMVSISALNNHKEEVIEIMVLSLTKETSKVLVDKIIDADANLRIIIIGGQSGMRASFKVSANDLMMAKEKFSNMTEGQKLITSNVVGMKIKLPVSIDDITTMTGLSITPSALIYKYEINDRETGNDMEELGGFMKAITMSQMSAQITQGGYMGERNRQFFQALIDCGQGVKAEYYELNTSRRTSFEISVSEMEDILNGKYKNNAPTKEDWENLGRAVEELEQLFEAPLEEEDYSMSSVDAFDNKMNSCNWITTTTESFNYSYPDFMTTSSYFCEDTPGDVVVHSWGKVELCHWPLLGYFGLELAGTDCLISNNTKARNITYKEDNLNIYSGYTTDNRIYYMKAKGLYGGDVPHATVLVLIYPQEFQNHMQKLTDIVRRW